MSRKRRMFDIEAPAEALAEAEAPEAAPRRGPMAAAVRETADAVGARAVAEAVIRAENDALAEAHVAARRAGLLLEPVDPDAIEEGFLHRDRAAARDAEIDALKDSIRELGLSNPIRLAPLGGGRYALIQGWRRLVAWKELRAETGDPAYARIPAAVSAADAALTTAYRRMVDENLVRREVSFAEMARLARAFAADHGGGDLDAAVDALFRSAPPQKRSYIRAFAELLDRVEPLAEHAEAIPRDLGLAVRRRLGAETAAWPELREALRREPGRTAARELAILRAFAENRRAPPGPPSPPRGPSGGATTARLADGSARILALGGRASIRATRDIAAAGPARLAAALAAFFRALDAPDA
jgi:ParB family chromosome partitioning protein